MSFFFLHVPFYPLGITSHPSSLGSVWLTHAGQTGSQYMNFALSFSWSRLRSLYRLFWTIFSEATVSPGQLKRCQNDETRVEIEQPITICRQTNCNWILTLVAATFPFDWVRSTLKVMTHRLGAALWKDYLICCSKFCNLFWCWRMSHCIIFN